MRYFIISAMLSASYGLAGELPFVYEKTNSFVQGAGDVIFQDDGFVLRRNPLTRSMEFQNLYVIDLKDQPIALDLAKFGSVVDIKDGSYAVVRMSDVAASKLSATLHHVHTKEEQGLGCGKVFRLFGDAIQAPLLNGSIGPVHPVAQKNAKVEAAVADINDGLIRKLVESLSSRKTRYHKDDNAKNVATSILEEYKAIATNRQDVQFEEVTHTTTPQKSFVVRIVGATKPNEIVVLGSHIDSIAMFGLGTAPGADDNASGTGTNLEIFRSIVQNNLRFDRTIEIHGYAGEEGGLLGSQEIAKKYRKEEKNVVAMVQFDMNIYSEDSVDKIWLVSNKTNEDLNNNLASLTDLYVGAPWEKAVLTAGSSDHASWDRQGYPAAFPFENPRAYNKNIHTRRDTIENSGVFSLATAFAKLGVAYVGHYAGVLNQ
ncbi:MAG: M28 family peptidase [Oligoflexales bacterium]